MGDPRVNFMVIGVQKAGTTALFDYLGDHPDLALSAEKELHFFDDETQDWAQPSYDRYHARFPRADGRIRGEATPIYIYWPGALERIAAYNPDAKLILMLRDPVARAWSHWRMEARRGVEMHDFAWCIRQGRRRLFEADPWGHHREFSYVERGFYGEQIERLYRLFPERQVLVRKAEDLRADPARVLGEVADFLETERMAPPAARDVHVGDDQGDPPAADQAWLRQIYAPDSARLKALIGIAY